MESGTPQMTEAQKYLPWVNLAILMLLLPLVAANSCTRPNTVLVADTTSSVVVGNDVADALKKARGLLENDDFAGSFDMLLVASRLAPSDPSLFDLVAQFVEQASASKSEEALGMAEDLLGRGDSLVYFQRPQNVGATRKRLSELRQKFIESEPAFVPVRPLDTVMQFISVGKDPTIGASIRTRAADQARSLLDDLQLQIAVGEQMETEELNQAMLKDIYEQIDSIEQKCIESLFGELQPRVNEWKDIAPTLMKEAEAATSEQAPEMRQKLNGMADSGFDLLQELLPYTKSAIATANVELKAVEKLVEELQRQMNWLYNKASLERIRKIESAVKETPQEKIRWLAEIHEEQLSPYVLRRYNELWEKVFEKLSSEEEKVNAVRLRILRANK
ncbi:MAG: hypothetical protein KF752_11960 [Pirellulaceae bacterium]|nr:hypothetical protein [Pirellulaceae bacterium]